METPWHRPRAYGLVGLYSGVWDAWTQVQILVRPPLFRVRDAVHPENMKSELRFDELSGTTSSSLAQTASSKVCTI